MTGQQQQGNIVCARIMNTNNNKIYLHMFTLPFMLSIPCDIKIEGIALYNDASYISVKSADS